jgi:hypothetical protein
VLDWRGVAISLLPRRASQVTVFDLRKHGVDVRSGKVVEGCSPKHCELLLNAVLPMHEESVAALSWRSQREEPASWSLHLKPTSWLPTVILREP